MNRKQSSHPLKQIFHSHSPHQSGDIVGRVDGGFPGRHCSGEHQPLLVEPGSHLIEQQGEVKLRRGRMLQPHTRHFHATP